jgi:tRNA nucleotidyltransferase/poly(A) polymerase
MVCFGASLVLKELHIPAAIMRYSEIENTIHRDRYNALIFGMDRRDKLYLVGGYIRDVLRGTSPRDRDFIIRGNVLEFVRGIRKLTGGTIVTFEPKDTIRLVLHDGHTFDFTELKGTIEDNLASRDFTINALAWSPSTGFIDIFKGASHIENRVVTCISEINMTHDPLRMLRAYRFAAELNGRIARNTRHIIKQHRKKICLVSNERITLEMFHLLNTEHPAKYLQMALTDCMLHQLLLCNNNMLRANIKALHILNNEILHLLPEKIKVSLDRIISQNLTHLGLLNLHTLIRSCTDRAINTHLSLSKTIRKRIKLVNDGLLTLEKRKRITKRALFTIFHNAREAAKDVLIVGNRLPYLSEYDRFEELFRRGFLSSEEIMKISGLAPGIHFGEILLALRRAEFEGRVKSRRDALTFVRAYQH